MTSTAHALEGRDGASKQDAAYITDGLVMDGDVARSPSTGDRDGGIAHNTPESRRLKPRPQHQQP